MKSGEEHLEKMEKNYNLKYYKRSRTKVNAVPLELEAPKKRKKIIYNNFILFLKTEGFWG